MVLNFMRVTNTTVLKSIFLISELLLGVSFCEDFSLVKVEHSQHWEHIIYQKVNKTEITWVWQESPPEVWHSETHCDLWGSSPSLSLYRGQPRLPCLPAPPGASPDQSLACLIPFLHRCSEDLE